MSSFSFHSYITSYYNEALIIRPPVVLVKSGLTPPSLSLHCQLSFLGILRRKLEVGLPQQYRAWTGCTDMHVGLALHWWQRLITFGFGRIRVNRKGGLNFECTFFSETLLYNGS